MIGYYTLDTDERLSRSLKSKVRDFIHVRRL